MKGKAFVVLATLITLVGLLVLSCAKKAEEAKPTAEAGKPTYGGVIRIPWNGDPPSLDPAEQVSYLTHGAIGLVYNRLLRFKVGPDVEPWEMIIVPDLAEKWEVSPDGKTYTFHLRKGVKFQNVPPLNGRELTSEDVKYSFERQRSSETPRPNKWLFESLGKIEIPDKYTVKFVLDKPFAPFMSYIPYTLSWIYPKELVERPGGLLNAAIGTGPYILSEFTRGNRAIYKKNPDYFEKGIPYADEIQGLVMPDRAAQYAAMRAGQVDFVDLNVPQPWYEFKKDYPQFKFDKVISRYGSSTLNLRVDKSPFDDVRVRKALFLSIDAQAVRSTIRQNEVPLQGPVPAQLKEWALPEDELTKLYTRDVAKAKELLAQAGKTTVKGILKVNSAFAPTDTNFAALLKEQTKEAGFDLEIVLLEYPAWLKVMTEGDYQLLVAGPGAFPDPDGWLYARFHSQSAFNAFGVKDPTLDKMLEEQRHELDVAKRKKIILEASRYILDKVYNIPVTDGAGFYVWNPALKNFRPSWNQGYIQFSITWVER